MRVFAPVAVLLCAGLASCVHVAPASGDPLQTDAAQPVRQMFQDPGPSIATMAVVTPVTGVASWELHMSPAGLAVQGNDGGGAPKVVYAVALDVSGEQPVVEQGIQLAADVEASASDVVHAIRDALSAYVAQGTGSAPQQAQDITLDGNGGTSLTTESGAPLTSSDGGSLTTESGTSLVCRVWSWLVGKAVDLLSSSSGQTQTSTTACGTVGPGCQSADTGSGGFVSSTVAQALMYASDGAGALFSQRTADLRAIDQGQSKPDPSTRLGAYAATTGYPPGTVGHGVHSCIGKLYQVLGTAGQEQIGTFFGSAPVQANLDHPIGSSYNLAAAQAEYGYWTNVLNGNYCSVGGYLGSAVPPSTRAYLQQNVCDPDPPVAGY